MTDNRIDKLASWELWLFPLILIVPNVMLAATSQFPLIFKITNIALPLGIYYLIISCWRRVSLTMLLCFPLIFLAAFQIVLIYLYGGGIIAIDMMLNLVTTNVSEASELLGGLFMAVGLCAVLYIPPLCYGIYATARGLQAPKGSLWRPRLTGVSLAVSGLAMLAVCYAEAPRYSIMRRVFPVNVMSNAVEAFHRTERTNRYGESSGGYSFYAHSERPADEPEIYVLVVGETSRADNWQLFGYERSTNPLLSERSNLIAYPKAMSESNTTHKSVPMLLTDLDATTFGDSIYYSRSLLQAFKEAGFATAFLSNQQRNHSFIDLFAEQADTVAYISDESEPALDGNLLPLLGNYLARHKGQKVLVVLHTYGSHFNYRDRYPRDFSVFKPDDYISARVTTKPQLVNAYDNSILYTDWMLSQVMDTLEATGVPAALVYASDHGEDLYDDARERFLHASPTPTYEQLHVPMLVWMSHPFAHEHPELLATAKANAGQSVSSTQSVFHTLVSLAGLHSPRLKPGLSLVSDSYVAPKRLYINDYNEPVDMRASGFSTQDSRKLDFLETK